MRSDRRAAPELLPLPACLKGVYARLRLAMERAGGRRLLLRLALVAQTINKLHGEMADRGCRPIGIVFDDGVTEQVVHDLAQLLKLKYPVGYTTSDQVDRYLGRAGLIRFQVPQVVVIDRAGVIRAESRPSGEANLTDENYLRHLFRELLDEDKSEKSTVPPRPSN